MKGESVAVNQEGLQHLFVRQYFNIKNYALHPLPGIFHVILHIHCVA